MKNNNPKQKSAALDIKFKFIAGEHVWVRIWQCGHPVKDVPAEVLYNVVEQNLESCEQRTTVRYLDSHSECRYACIPVSWLHKFSKKDEELLKSNSF